MGPTSGIARPLAALVCTAALVAAPARGQTSAPPASDHAGHDGHAMPSVPATVAEWAHGAQLFDGLGEVHRPVTSRVKGVQRWFDQGLSFAWAFNHDEATRSFARAAELDPRCAACWWGLALTVGPNYNLPMLSAPRARVARDALLRAERHARGASPVERALIAALAKRYPDDKPLDPAAALPVLTAYADAMAGVARRFPDDLDVQVLYAESLMNLHAWKLWAPDGTPAPGTETIVATLERVLARDPHHLGANHYLVHALEASPTPQRALAAAGRLAVLAPAAGHLVHMPAHVLHRVGRYEESAEANRRAVVADEKYAASTTPPDYYGMYYGHNLQFLSFSAAMAGRRAEAISAADRGRTSLPDAMLAEMPGVDWYAASNYLARVRFGAWDELLAMPAPVAGLPGLGLAWHYAHTIALAATGRATDARAAYAALAAYAAAIPADAGAGQNLLRDVAAVAVPTTEARVLEAEGHRPEAIARWREAAAAEDRLGYDEPKNWFFPVRHELGAALLRAGDAPGAERVYREDLVQNPDNGWAYKGLSLALRAQGRAAEADETDAKFRRAWSNADVTIAASAY
jgi:tetratricopeptide (TPR) repeat protein